jgi:hypothetical protein
VLGRLAVLVSGLQSLCCCASPSSGQHQAATCKPQLQQQQAMQWLMEELLLLERAGHPVQHTSDGSLQAAGATMVLLVVWREGWTLMPWSCSARHRQQSSWALEVGRSRSGCSVQGQEMHLAYPPAQHSSRLAVP